MENLIEMDDLGVPLIFGNTHNTNLPLKEQPFMDRLFFAGSPSRPSFAPLVYRILYMDHSGDRQGCTPIPTYDMGNPYISKPFLCG